MIEMFFFSFHYIRSKNALLTNLSYFKDVENCYNIFIALCVNRNVKCGVVIWKNRSDVTVVEF